MKRIIPLMLILFIILSLPAKAEQPTEEQHQINVIDNSMKAAVSISNFVDGASGFFVAPNYILTNEHVVEGIPKPTIYTSLGACLDNVVIATDKIKDLALIKSNCKGEAYIPLADSVKVGQDAYIIGDPKKIGIMVTSGLVALIKDDKTARGIYIDANVYSGNSGSMAIDSDGKLIGVVFGHDTRAQTLAVAVHLTDVRNFLQRNGINQ